MTSLRRGMIAALAGWLCISSAQADLSRPQKGRHGARSGAVSTFFIYDLFNQKAADLRRLHQERLISFDQYRNMRADDPSILLLDVREAGAYQYGHFENAVNLPRSRLTREDMEKALPDKYARIVIYGDQALQIAPTQEMTLVVQAFPILYEMGYENLYELREGMLEARETLERQPFVGSQEARESRCKALFWNQSHKCLQQCTGCRAEAALTPLLQCKPAEECWQDCAGGEQEYIARCLSNSL